MKYLLSLLIALVFTLMQHNHAAATPRETQRAMREVRAAYSAMERVAREVQSLDALNAAAREQVIRELKLSGQKRRAFEELYTAYRTALDTAIKAVEAMPADEAAQREQLRVKLANIAATAQVKRDYIDKFSSVLSAEQIRQLYNTEGAISTNIKRAAADRLPRIGRLKGSGRMVTQDWGQAGAYTHLVAGSFCSVTISPTARTISVTADDNVVDYIAMQNEGGKLEFRLNSQVNGIENVKIQITVPPSAALSSLSTAAYGKVGAAVPLKVASMKVSASSYGSVAASIESSGAVQIDVSSYGRFSGAVSCTVGEFRISSYGRAEGAIACRERCEMQMSSYARFADEIKTPKLSLLVSSYAKFTGSVAAAQASISAGSYSSFNGAFSGESLVATLSNYASMTLAGSAVVADAQVSVAYGASFSAPTLRVTHYDLKASANSKSNLWCSGVLKIDAPLQARVEYAGPCTVERSLKTSDANHQK